MSDCNGEAVRVVDTTHVAPVEEDEFRQCRLCRAPVTGKPFGDPYTARIDGELCDECVDQGLGDE